MGSIIKMVPVRACIMAISAGKSAKILDSFQSQIWGNIWSQRNQSWNHNRPVMFVWIFIRLVVLGMLRVSKKLIPRQLSWRAACSPPLCIWHCLTEPTNIAGLQNSRFRARALTNFRSGFSGFSDVWPCTFLYCFGSGYTGISPGDSNNHHHATCGAIFLVLGYHYISLPWELRVSNIIWVPKSVDSNLPESRPKCFKRACSLLWPHLRQ